LLRQRARCPHQQLVLLSGDIHEALAVALHPKGGALPIYQLVSSPVTNTQRGVLQWVAHTASRITRHIELQGDRLRIEPLSGVGDARRNFYAALNVGIVEVDARGGSASPIRSRLRFKVLAPSPGAGDLAVVFDSGEL
jgi:hypothetical protein